MVNLTSGQVCQKKEGFSSKKCSDRAQVQLFAVSMCQSHHLGQLLWNAILRRNCTGPPLLSFKIWTYFLYVARLLLFLWCHIHTVFIENFLFIHNSVATLASYVRQTESSYRYIQPASTITRRCCIALFCLNYHLQYFVLCVWVDNWLALSIITSHTYLCGPAVAAYTMLQQCRGCNVYVHPDVNVSYVCYNACANNLQSSIGGTWV